jgi:hypothetical protein
MNANAIMSLIALVAFLCLFYGPWQDFCTDYVRQRLFERRDTVFDMARNGELDFNSYEYRTLRRALEAQIRFAHDLTLMRFAVLGAILSKEKSSAESSTLKAIKSIERADVREKVQQLFFLSTIDLLTMMAVRSLLCLALIPLFVIIAIITWCATALRDKLVELLNFAEGVIQAEAEYGGEPVRVRKRKQAW